MVMQYVSRDNVCHYFNMGNMSGRALMSYESASKNGTDIDHNQNGWHD